MMNAMVIYSLNFGIMVLSIAVLLCFFRLLKGPTVVDRILALDSIFMNAMILMVVLGMRFNQNRLLEAVLILSLLGFLSTVVLARFITRGDAIE